MLIRVQPPYPSDTPVELECRYTNAEYRKVDCWRNWWLSERRNLEHAVMSIWIDSKVHETTLRNYVQWLRQLGADARLVDHALCLHDLPSVATNMFVGSERASRWSVDLSYSVHDNAARTFVIWNLARFLVTEFTVHRHQLDVPMTAEEYVSTLFNVICPNTNHMPFTDMYTIVKPKTIYEYGRYTTRPPEYEWQRDTGQKLFSFFTWKLAQPDWHPDTIYQRDVSSSSRISFREFLTWLSRSSTIDNVSDNKKGTDTHEQGNTGHRPRDSRGRFIRIEATGAGS